MKKFLLGAGVVATLSVGTIVFTGGDIIDQVNTKVAGMFDMLSQYENNEQQLVNKINNLKDSRDNLKSQVKELTTSNKDKDTQISNLNTQIAELNRQVEILEQQLGNKNGLVQEITRLEGEVNKANSKVAELQNILDTQIIDAPLTESEMKELLPFDGTIYFSSESADETIVQLSSYAEMHIKKFSSVDGPDEFLCTIRSTTDDAFEVSFISDPMDGSEGSVHTELCLSNSPVTFKVFLGYSYNYTEIKINDGEFTYKLIVE